MSKVVPDAVRLAAKRGFARTTFQGYAATLGGGITATVIIGLIQGTVDPVVLAVTVGVALVSPLLAGAASYASIASKGIPDEYQVSPDEVRGRYAAE